MSRLHYSAQYGANPSQIIYELLCSKACCVKNILRMSDAKSREWSHVSAHGVEMQLLQTQSLCSFWVPVLCGVCRLRAPAPGFAGLGGAGMHLSTSPCSQVSCGCSDG